MTGSYIPILETILHEKPVSCDIHGLRNKIIKFTNTFYFIVIMVNVTFAWLIA